jgi:hypothetical protein
MPSLNDLHEYHKKGATMCHSANRTITSGVTKVIIEITDTIFGNDKTFIVYQYQSYIKTLLERHSVVGTSVTH